MKAYSGFINIWDNEDELKKRQSEASDLADHLFPGDSKMKNRLINLAQGINDNNWLIVRALSGSMLQGLLDGLVNYEKAPFDEPYDSQVKRLK